MKSDIRTTVDKNDPDISTGTLPDRRSLLKGAAATLGLLLGGTARPALAADETLNTAFAVSSNNTGPSLVAFDYKQVGREFIAQHLEGVTTFTPDSYYTLLEKACYQVELGAVTVYVPKDSFDLTSKNGQGGFEEHLKFAIPAVLRGVLQLSEWSTESGDKTSLSKRSKAIDKLMSELEKKIVCPEFNSGPVKLADLFKKADDKTLLAIQALLSGNAAGGTDSSHAQESAPQEGAQAKDSGVPLVILSNRAQMVKFACAAGVLAPNFESTFHDPSIFDWLHGYYGEPSKRVQLLCLQQSPFFGEDYSKLAQTKSNEEMMVPGPEMDKALVKQSILFDTVVGLVSRNNVPSWFAMGVAFNAVLEQYGEFSGQLGADTLGDITPSTARFVPGGASHGGRLPPNLSTQRAPLEMADLTKWLEVSKKKAEDGLTDDQKKAVKKGEETVCFGLGKVDGTGDPIVAFGPVLERTFPGVTKDFAFEFSLWQRAYTVYVIRSLAQMYPDKFIAFMAQLPKIEEGKFDAKVKEVFGSSLSDLEREVCKSLK